MIAETDISDALGQHLATMDPDMLIGWENDDVPIDAQKPYLLFQMVRVSRTDDTLKGGMAISRGYVTVTVFSALDAYANAALRIADRISAHFPYAMHLPVTGGSITITKPAEIEPGYPDMVHWRTPVRIDYSAS